MTPLTSVQTALFLVFYEIFRNVWYTDRTRKATETYNRSLDNAKVASLSRPFG